MEQLEFNNEYDVKLLFVAIVKQTYQNEGSACTYCNHCTVKSKKNLPITETLGK